MFDSSTLQLLHDFTDEVSLALERQLHTGRNVHCIMVCKDWLGAMSEQNHSYNDRRGVRSRRRLIIRFALAFLLNRLVSWCA